MIGLAQFVLLGFSPVVALPSSFIRSNSLLLIAALKSSTVFSSLSGSRPNFFANSGIVSALMGSWSVVS